MSSRLIDRTYDRLSEPASTPRRPPRIFEFTFSAVGLLTGLYFLAISLTPSLLPRAGFMQGLGSGLAFIIGYGLGASLFAVLQFLGVPRARGRVRVVLLVLALAVISLQASLAIWNYVDWQNQTRNAFGIEPLSQQVWLAIAAVAVTTAVVLLVVG